MHEISIVIPVYKVENFIGKCLDSLLHQTFSDIEIICVDDGSPDRSGEILDEYASQDSRIQVIHQANAGAGAARNLGITKATGKYMMFCDSDDWYEPEMCETMRRYMLEQNVDLVTCNAYIDVIDRKLPKGTGGYGIVPGGHYKRVTPFFFLSIVGSSVLMIYKKSIIDLYNIRFGEIAMNEDYIFTREYLLVTKSFYISNQWLYHYQLHQNSLVDSWQKNSQSTNQNFDFIKPYEEIHLFLQKNGLLEQNLPLFTFCYIAFIRSTWRNVPNTQKTNFLKVVHSFLQKTDINHWGSLLNNYLISAIMSENYPKAIFRMNLWPYICLKMYFIWGYLVLYRKIFGKMKGNF